MAGWWSKNDSWSHGIGGKGQQEGISGELGEVVDQRNLENFVAHWGLDEKCQEVLISLDPVTLAKVMSGFQPKDLPSASRMFMGFVKSVSGKGGAPTAQQAFGGGGGGSTSQPAEPTGNDVIDGFIAQWGLDATCQDVLINLDIETQLKILSGFQPRDPSRSNQMFMGFVKSVTGGKGGGSMGEQAGGDAIDGFAAALGLGGPQSRSQLYSMDPDAQLRVKADNFIAQWGLDTQARDALVTLDSETQLRVMSGFKPSDISRVNQMFMGFVKSVAGKGGGQTPRQTWGGGGGFSQGGGGFSQSSGGFGKGSANANADAIDNLMAQLGFDASAQEVLSQLDPESQQTVTAALEGLRQQTQGSTSGVHGGNAAAFAAHWGLDSKCQEVLSGLDPMTQQKVMNDFNPKDAARANQMFMGFVKSVASSGAPTAPQAFGFSARALQPPAATGNDTVDNFITQWGLDAKSQETLLNLEPETASRVMSGFQPKDPSRANQMFMGFVKSVSGGGGAPTAQQAFGGGFGGGYGNVSMAVAPGIDAFVAQWGLDHKCRELLGSLDAATQERVMGGFAPNDFSQASRMFMGFVKSVSSGGKGSRFSPY